MDLDKYLKSMLPQVNISVSIHQFLWGETTSAHSDFATMEPHCLPPHTNLDKFHEFCARASQLCDEANVLIISRSTTLIDGDYMQPCKAHDMHALYDRDAFVASAVISPRNVPEVQGVVRLCNEYLIPMWPFSIGRNTGYGGTAPRVSGSVGVDLGKHLNKVLEVNVEGAYALVEPGVTFTDLHMYLEERNLRDQVWLDVPDLGGGSIIGMPVASAKGSDTCS